MACARWMSYSAAYRMAPAVIGAVGAMLLLVGCGGAPGGGQQGGPPQGKGKQGGGPPQMPPAKVRFGKAEVKPLQQRIDVVGRLREVRRATVSAELAGRIDEVMIEEGDPVTADKTVLAKIDDTFQQLALKETQAELAEATAAVAQAEALARKSKLDYDYLIALREKGSAQPREVDSARAQFEADQAALEAAKAKIDTIEARIKTQQEEIARTKVVAPFDGTVVRKFAEQGQWASSGTQIAEIVSRGHIDAVIDLPEALTSTVAMGQPITVRIDPLGVRVEGKVVAIVPEGMNPARTFPLKVRMKDTVDIAAENGDQARTVRLLPGMSATLSLPVGEMRPRVTVPRDAVLRSPKGSSVWVSSDGQAKAVPVDVVFGVGDRYVVQPVSRGDHPLEDGALVVIEGGERIAMPGQPLQDIAQAGGGAPPQGGGPTGAGTNEKTATPEKGTDQDVSRGGTAETTPKGTQG